MSVTRRAQRTLDVTLAIEEMREYPGALRTQWVEVPVVRDYWLEHNAGACEPWPRQFDHKALLDRMDDYLQGLGPMDRPAWIPVFREARDAIQPAVRSGGTEEDWDDLFDLLDEMEVFYRVDDPERSDAAAHLIEVAMDLQRGPWR
jgi:hypothetical protein